MKVIAVLLALSIIVFSTSFSQEQYGNLRGVVLDLNGQPLPGVVIILESDLYAPRSVIAADSGVFRFINVSPSVYTLKCSLPGFKNHVQQNLDIRVGTNFDLKIILEQAVLEEELTIRAESPIVDTKKTSIGANINQVMLQELPSARDPWAILQQAAGVQVATENVGGSQSGQQAIFLSKGTDYQDAIWNMDGINITDQAALASAMYYDFDSFEEMTIVTGGQDASVQTAGININFITRRGGNKFLGMSRVFFTNKDLQADNRTEELIKLNYIGDRINQIMDYGFQFGGPIFKDRLWFWLGFGIQDIRQLTIAGYPQDAELRNYNGKINAQISARNRTELAFYVPLKYAEGRGAGPSRPPETTQEQKPIDCYYVKLEDEHIFSPNFLLSFKASYFSQGTEWMPSGGLDTQVGQDIITGMFSGSMSYSLAKRPQYSFRLDGNIFREKLLAGNHEFKFGIEYRNTENLLYLFDPGDAWKLYRKGSPYLAYVEREERTEFASDRFSFYSSDAYTRGRLTLNLGLRLDREKSWIKESRVQASRIAPDFLPALTFPAIDPGIALWTLSPRIGFTFDFAGDGRTMLRGNIARYTAQMGTAWSRLLNPAQMAYALYFWKDLNGDKQVTTNELAGFPLKGILDFSGFDPWNPAKLETPNAIDKDVKAPLTDEILLGIEKEVFTNFAMGAALVLRRNHRFYWEVFYDKAAGTKITQTDFIGPIKGTLTYEAQSYAYEYWTLNRFRPVGLFRENQPDYHENYSSIEVTAVKRLSRRWMLNASFTYQVFNVHFGKKGYTDPTNVAVQDGARKEGGSDWMAKLSFLYELPWGFAASGYLNARQGYIFREQILVDTPERNEVGLGPTVNLDTMSLGKKRLANFYNADLSLAKKISLKKFGTLGFEVNAFNVFNLHHELSRYSLRNSSRYRQIQKILNPRVIRFGLRYTF